MTIRSSLKNADRHREIVEMCYTIPWKALILLFLLNGVLGLAVECTKIDVDWEIWLHRETVINVQPRLAYLKMEGR